MEEKDNKIANTEEEVWSVDAEHNGVSSGNHVMQDNSSYEEKFIEQEKPTKENNVQDNPETEKEELNDKEIDTEKKLNDSELPDNEKIENNETTNEKNVNNFEKSDDEKLNAEDTFKEDDENLKENKKSKKKKNKKKKKDDIENQEKSKKKSKPKKRKKKMDPKKKALIIAGIIVGLLATLSVAGAILWSFLNISFDDDDLKAKEELTETSFDEPFYMLLVGTDTREGDTYKLDDGRSDSCILVRIDPIKYIVTMISIPRDTKITYNGSTEKFNAVYAAGGISETIAQVKKMLNVDISHYAEISFNGLIDMIDAVGGVEVNVPNEIDDPNSGAYVAAGIHTLNGEEALSFSRSRNFGDGDFTRTADQRVLIEALIKKAYNMPLTDLPNLLRAAKNFVKTDLRLGDMLGLATQFINANQLTTYSAMIPSYTSGEGGVSYVITDKSGLRRFMKMVENGENPLYVELDSGASVCSSRDAEQVKKEQEEYYKLHPDSPGRIVNDTGYSSSSNKTLEYDTEETYNGYSSY